MQKLVAILLIVILAGSITIPNVFSDSENEQNTENDNNQNDNQNNAQENENHPNQTSTNESDIHDDKEKKIHFGFSNATSVNIILPNGTTITFGFSNGTNPGQQISAFIHQIRDIFKQQEIQAKQTIKDCREKAKDANPADRKTIMNECRAQLKQINQQFSSEHKQLQLDFKQFREMIIGNNQENHEDSSGQKGNVQNAAQFTSNQHGLEQQNSHGQKNNTIFQNTAQFAPHQHGQEQKLEHGKQNGKQKHGKED